MINDEKINNLNNKGNKMTKEAIQLEEKRTYYEAVNNLLENIKTDYANWTDWEEGIERFNEGIRTEDGRKYTKVITGTSVWGFIAKTDGVVKGLLIKKVMCSKLLVGEVLPDILEAIFLLRTKIIFSGLVLTT